MNRSNSKICSLLLFAVIFISVLSVQAYADVWWSGTPEMAINETSHFDAGTKSNTTTVTNRFNQSANTLEMDFPYANNTNVIAYWRFEGNLNNEAGQALTVGDAGVYNTTHGVFGQAYTFDGTADYLYLNDNDTYDFTDGSGHDVAFTLMWWLRSHKSTGTTGHAGMIQKGPFANPASWTTYHYSGRSRLYILKSDATQYEGFITGTSDFVAGSVNLYSFVYDGRGGNTASAGMTFYKNLTTPTKTLDDSGAYANMSGNNQPVYVGLNLGVPNYFDGEFDELMIIRGGTDGVGLTQTEVTRRFNNGKQYIDTSWASSNSTWTSDTQTMTKDHLENLTINLTQASANGYITSIEILKASDSSVLYTNTTDLTSAGLHFMDDTSAVNTNFKIKLYFAGDGSATPTVEDIIGSYEEASPAAADVVCAWQGGASTSWASSLNWNCSGIPGETNPVILNGSATYQPFLSNDSFAYNLTFIDTAGQLHLNGYNMWIDDKIQFHTAATGGYINATGNLTFHSVNPPGTTIRYGTIQADTSYFDKDIYIKLEDATSPGFQNYNYNMIELLLSGEGDIRIYIVSETFPDAPTNYWLLGTRAGVTSRWLNMTNVSVAHYLGSGSAWTHGYFYFENVYFTSNGGTTDTYLYTGPIYRFYNVTSMSDDLQRWYSINTITGDVPIINYTKTSGANWMRSSYLEFINSTFNQPYAGVSGYAGAVISKDHGGTPNDYRIWVTNYFTTVFQRGTAELTTNYQPDSDDNVIIMNGTTGTDYIASNINLNSSWSINNLTLYEPTTTSRTSASTDTYVADTIQIDSTELNVTSSSLLNASNVILNSGTLYFDDGVGNFTLLEGADDDTHLEFRAHQTEICKVDAIPTAPAGYNNSENQYANISNTSTESWIYLNFTYTDLIVYNESKLHIMSYDGTTWTDLYATTDEANDYIHVNATAFASPILLGLFEETNTTWQGGTSSDWSVASNWGNGVPSSVTPVVLNASSPYQPNLTATTYVKSLIIPDGAKLNTNSSIFQVEDGIDLSGTMNITGGKLIFNGSTDGESNLLVYSSGILYIENLANITNGDTDSANYAFYLALGSTGNFTDSYIRKAGWEDDDTKYNNGITISTDNVNMHNMAITEMDCGGLYLNYSDYGNYTYNTINATEVPVYLWRYSSNNTFTENQIWASIGDAVYMAYSSDNNFTNNNISLTGSIRFSGINMAGASNNNNFTSNNVTALSPNDGITVSESNNNIFINTTISNKAYDSLHIYEACDNQFENLTITNTNSSGYGIYAEEDSYGNNITSATITSSGYGMAVYKGPYNNYLINSTIAGSTNDFYAIGDTSGNLTLENCSFDDKDYLIGGTGSNTIQFYVKYFLDAYAFNISSAGVPGAGITITDVNSATVFTGSTDASGYTGYQLLQAYIRNRTGIIESTPHIISAASGTYETKLYAQNSTTWNLTSNKTSIASLYLPLVSTEIWYVYSADAYDTNYNASSFFADGDSIIIAANATSNALVNISIYDPNGTMIIDNDAMYNNTGATANNTFHYYNYTINGTAGWYNVTVGNISAANVFYQGYLWSYTDAADIANTTWRNSTEDVYPFRVEINATEQNATQRWFEVIDTWVDFSQYGAHNLSIRVGQYNGSHVFEIPSQIYNQTFSGDTLEGANVVFLASLNASQTKTYYIYYNRNNVGSMNYSRDLNYTNSSNTYTMENKYYRIRTDGSLGGIISEAFDKLGTNSNISGASPMEDKLELAILGGSTCSITDQTTPTITVEQGDVFTKYTATDYLGTCAGLINYRLTYTVFSNVPYVLIETNVSTLYSDTDIKWTYFEDKRVRYLDGWFANLTYMNSADVVSTYPLTTGDGTDYEGLGNLKYIGLYNNTTRDAVADIFVSRNQTVSTTPDVDYYDEASKDWYQRYIIDTVNTPVAPDSVFYAKTARMIFDGIAGPPQINNTYYTLVAPCVITNGTHRTYDTEPPVNVSASYDPAAPTNMQDVSCNSSWIDNLELDHAIITENSTGTNATHTVTIDGTTEGNASMTIYSDNLTHTNTATAYVLCSIEAYDIAGNANTTYVYIPVTDAIAPMIDNVLYDPNSTDSVDPDVALNVTANITDYVAVDTAILQWRQHWNATWNNITMDHDSGSKIANATLTPDNSTNYTIRIWAKDTSNNVDLSSEQNISVANDITWILTPADWGTLPAAVTTTRSITNLTIHNTGDTDLNFSITTNYDIDRTWYNISDYGNFNISAGIAVPIEVTMKAQDTPKISPMNISVTASASGQSERTQRSSGTLISFTAIGVPYLYLTIPVYNTSSVVSASFNVSGRIDNLGDTVATNVWMNYTLPSGWTITEGEANKTFIDIGAGPHYWSNITVAVPSDAVLGDNTITLDADCSEGTNYTISITVSVSGTTPGGGTYCGDGTCNGDETYLTCPADCAAPIIPPSGGGGSIGVGGGSSDKLFSTSSVYEIVRGNDSSFDMTVSNPFINSTMNNVKITTTGLLSKYMTIYPEVASVIEPGKNYTFAVKITAPSYFTTGDHKLLFTIRSKVTDLNTQSSYDMVEDRSVILSVHDISRAAAASMIEAANKILKQMSDAGFHTEAIQSLLDKLSQSFESRNYEDVQSIYSQIDTLKESAFDSQELIAKMEDAVWKAANRWGLQTEQTERIINLAKLAFMRGDYAVALERIKEAQLTYALETKGEWNIPFIIVHYWYYVLLGIAAGAVILFLSYKRIKLYVLKHKIKMLTKEEQVLLGLMKVIQNDAFEKGKMSMSEYVNAMIEYEKRLNEVVKDIIKFQTQKSHLFDMKGKEKQLMEERTKLMRLIKETQAAYMKGAKLETRVYQNKMRSYSERFSEIEESLATLEAEKAEKAVKKRSGIKKLFKRSRR